MRETAVPGHSRSSELLCQSTQHIWLSISTQ